MIRGSGGSKSRLPKAAGAEPCGQRRNEKLHAAVGAKHIFQVKMLKLTFGPLLDVGMQKNGTPLWREAHSQLKMLKNMSADVEKWHAAVVRSTFPSQNAKNMRVSGYCQRDRCRKT